MPNQPRPSFQSPRFAQPATFMRLPHVEDPAGLDVAIVGIPYDGGTSYRPGARLGPREIRNQSSLIRTYNYFQKVAPFDRLNVADVGDVDASPVSIEKAYTAIEARIGAIADAGLDRGIGLFDADGRRIDVADICNVQPIEWRDLLKVVVGADERRLISNLAGSQARARTVGGAPVIRDPDNGHVQPGRILDMWQAHERSRLRESRRLERRARLIR